MARPNETDRMELSEAEKYDFIIVPLKGVGPAKRGKINRLFVSTAMEKQASGF